MKNQRSKSVFSYQKRRFLNYGFINELQNKASNFKKKTLFRKLNMTKKLKLYQNKNDVYEVNELLRIRESEKNEFEMMSLFGRAKYISDNFKIDKHKIIDESNYKLYFYKGKQQKPSKILEVIDDVVYDPDYQEEGIRKQVDMFNSGWLRAYIIRQEERGVPYSDWVVMSKSCKIRLYIQILTTDTGNQDTKLMFFCKTKIEGKWKWTGNSIEVKKRTPKEKCKVARYLFGEKGISSTKAIKKMLGYKTLRPIQKCIKDLRKGKNECKI